MRVLLTGSSGQLGKAILRHVPPAWDMHSPTRQELDLTNQSQTSEYFNQNQFDLVIHTAAKVGGIQANVQDPSGFLYENLMINQSLIHAAFETGVQNLINIGSSCMYPRDHGVLKETDILAAPLEPTNEGYALAKITAAKYCEYLSAQHGVHYKTLIPCNLYGPDDNFDLETGHLVASAIRKIHEAKQNNNQTVEIWGTGEVRREFLYIDDLAEFIIDISEKLSGVPPMLNVGYGKDYTVNDYYKIIADVLNYEGSFSYNTKKPVGMSHKLMNSMQAQKLGWAPKTPLKDGIEKIFKRVFSN